MYKYLIDPSKEFTNLLEAFKDMTKIYKSQLEGAWSVPLIRKFTQEIYKVAKAMNEESCWELASSSIRDLFSACQSCKTPPPDSKIMAAFTCLNYMFKINFRINKLRLCTNLAAWVQGEQSLCPSLSLFLKSEQATYAYYQGRLFIYDQNLKKAEQMLDFAFDITQTVRNRQLILRYLIPVKIFLGKFPTQALLENYNQTEFLPFIQAIKTGNLKNFEEQMSKQEEKLIDLGIFLLMEKLRLVLYRNLFKQVCNIFSEITQLKIEIFQKALQLCDEIVDLDETQSVLGTLITLG